MKRLYYVFIMVWIAMFSYNPVCSSEVIVTDFTKFKKKLVKGENLISKKVFQEGKHSVVEFKYSNCKRGSRYLEFWLCPAKHKDETFEEYFFKVNNENVWRKLTPAKAGWQNIGLTNDIGVDFQEGDNTIQVLSSDNTVPSIDFIEVSPVEQHINISEYAYKEFISSPFNYAGKTKELEIKINSEEDPLYEYSYARDLNFNYSFNKSIYLEKNELVEVDLEGIDGYEAIMYFFKETEPEKFSWTKYPEEDGRASFKLSVPEAGYYKILLKSLWGTHIGFCNLVINEEEYFDVVPVAGTSMILNGDTKEEYNIYTVAHSGDPIAWIEEEKASETVWGYTTKIVDFCDDGDEDGDFDWTVNPRIRRSDSSKNKRIFITSYSSNSPSGRCDLYMGCKNASERLFECFRNLNSNDAIISSKATSNYNCISWSGGITSYWEWPLSPSSQYYSENALEAFDNFYESCGFSRYGADPLNSAIALWAYVDANGNRTYSHASIRRNIKDNLMHGYDWESKAGSLERVFHPCNAIYGKPGIGYGQIVEYYDVKVRASDASNIVQNASNIWEESYSVHEDNAIKDFIAKIRSDIRTKLEILYDKFKTVVDSSPHTNPDLLRDCEEYRELESFISRYPALKYMIFEKLGKNELPSILILDELIGENSELKQIRERIRSRVKTLKQEDNTYFPIQSNLILLVKEYLRSNLEEEVNDRELKDSKVVANIDAEGITIELKDADESAVNVELYDQFGNLIRRLDNIQPDSDGRYIFVGNINSLKGLYVLKISFHDGIIVRKIRICIEGNFFEVPLTRHNGEELRFQICLYLICFMQ